MTPSRPYLIRALYEWIADNNMTPHVTVDTDYPGAMIPKDFANDGKIVLNISHSATKELRVGNDAIEFKARFGSKIFHIYVPIPAVLAIFSRETQKGMVFSLADIENYKEDSGDGGNIQEIPPIKKTKPKKSHLKLVKG